jgi:hypothetical protein
MPCVGFRLGTSQIKETDHLKYSVRRTTLKYPASQLSKPKGDNQAKSVSAQQKSVSIQRPKDASVHEFWMRLKLESRKENNQPKSLSVYSQPKVHLCMSFG